MDHSSAQKAAVLHLLEPKTKLYYNTFRQCQACGQGYWEGSHVGELGQLVAEVQEAGPEAIRLNLAQATQPIGPA